jgi:hypothetical protein
MTIMDRQGQRSVRRLSNMDLKSAYLDLEVARTMLIKEFEAGTVNSLESFQASQVRRAQMQVSWAQAQATINELQSKMQMLSPLPPSHLVKWAQAILAMRDVVFMEIDTTGLGEEDEIIRFTLMDRSFQVIEDILILPSHPLTEETSRINGITPAQLAEQGIGIVEAWERISTAVRGKYVISYAQDWDLKQLQKAARHHDLDPITIIGECLQHRASNYYHHEYSLSLAVLCERAGHPLPAKPNQSSLDRAKGQISVIQAMANAVTNLTPAKLESTEEAAATSTVAGADPDDGLGDFEDHPF